MIIKMILENVKGFDNYHEEFFKIGNKKHARAYGKTFLKDHFAVRIYNSEKNYNSVMKATSSFNPFHLNPNYTWEYPQKQYNSPFKEFIKKLFKIH